MKRALLFISLLSCAATLDAQCLGGNCKDGTGKYDYGWCTYEGEFKDGNMHGQGTIDYGSGEKYTGQFRNGKEHGDGTLIHANGTTEHVTFNDGQRVKAAQPYTTVAANREPPKDGCIEGDCVNGTGTYIFPSGNKYTGQWRNYAREGQGTCYFANGDKFTGIFHNNEFASGTYTYAGGYSYTGTYDAGGRELNGTYTAPNGNTADMKGGKVAEPQYTTVQQGPRAVVCPECKGRKGTYIAGKGTTYTQTGASYTNHIDRYGNTKSEMTSVGHTEKHTDYGHFVECATCHGRGIVVTR